MSRILLIEPSYKNKYPPLGLMKISTYHKFLGDDVVFFKGENKKLKKKKWDRIYITTMFTFHWNIIIRTIKFYLKSVECPENLYIGGPMASIMAEEILCQDGLEDIQVLRGLLNQPGMLDDNGYIIDELIPDYSIVDIENNEYLDYKYPVNNAYFIHSTRGCIRKCEFCAVPKLEPDLKYYIDIKPRIKQISELYGAKCDLTIMDNNVLASPNFEKIIDDIINCGFGKDINQYKYIVNGRKIIKKRYVDFNQGLDARILYAHPEKMDLLSKVAIKPMRVAFDYANEEFIEIYSECMRMAAQKGIKDLSNYILFNLNDTTDDLYVRLWINVMLNQEFKKKGLHTKIWSFPMRYSPLYGEHAKDRKHVGEYWSTKQIRGVQCILNATHGMVGPKIEFFYRAFGSTKEDYNEIIWMPDNYIIQRKENEENGNTFQWRKLFRSLDDEEWNEFKVLIAPNMFNGIKSDNAKIQKLLEHYLLK